MINVLVVDDQNLTHKLIKSYLESEQDLNIVGFANDGKTAIKKVQSLNPDVVLMDVEMPIMDGLTATEKITQLSVPTKVLILTVHDNEQHLGRALQIGAKGYLLKTTTAQELAHAIRNVDRGYFQLGLELTEKYLYKIVRAKSEDEEITEFRRKLKYLSKSINQTNSKFKKLRVYHKNEITRTVESVVQQEMSLLKDRDSHLQFKVDRMKYGFDRLEQNASDLFKVQIICVLLTVLSLVYSLFVNFRA